MLRDTCSNISSCASNAGSTSTSSPAIGRRRSKATNRSQGLTHLGDGSAGSSRAANGHTALHLGSDSASSAAAGGGVSADLVYLTNKKLPTTTNSRRAQRRKGRLLGGGSRRSFRRGDSDASSRKSNGGTMKYFVAIFALALVYTAITSGGRQRAVRAALRRRRRAASLLRKNNGGGNNKQSGEDPYDVQQDAKAARAEGDYLGRRRRNNDGGEGLAIGNAAPGWKFWKHLGGGGNNRRQSNVPTEHGVWSPNRRYKWIDVRQLPPLPGQEDMIDRSILEGGLGRRPEKRSAKDFRVKHAGEPPMPWEAEADDDGMERFTATSSAAADPGLAPDPGQSIAHHGRGITGGSSPRVDYTSIEYTYPPTISEPQAEGGYPFLETLGTLMTRWPQDELDNPPQPFLERLQHFDYNDPDQMAMALRFRDEELPFKVYNVPEVISAGMKWTDEYVSSQFDAFRRKNTKNRLLDAVLGGGGGNDNGGIPMTKGHCQEARMNFFSFFQPMNWGKGVLFIKIWPSFRFCLRRALDLKQLFCSSFRFRSAPIITAFSD